MPAGVVNLKFLILGLLAQRPMSGYDIKRFMKSFGWLIGSLGGGSLYPVLRGLLEEDLVAVEVIPGLDRPPCKIYGITEAGRRALKSCIQQPVVASSSLKAFVMRLLLADSYEQVGCLLTCSSGGRRLLPAMPLWQKVQGPWAKDRVWDSV
jgi:DNA-binding PadR family transcriptional regulator